MFHKAVHSKIHLYECEIKQQNGSTDIEAYLQNMQNGLKQQNGSTHVETYLQKAAEWTVAANHNGDHDLDDDGNHDDTKADNATLPQQMKKM